MLKKKTFFYILLILAPCSLWSQFQTAFRADNYSGVNGVILNPAASAYFPLAWDINIAESDVFFNNNYTFLKNTNTLKLLKDLEKIENASLLFLPQATPSDLEENYDYILDVESGEKERYAVVKNRLIGPSFLINLSNNHHFGFVSSATVLIGSDEIPGVLSYYPYESKHYNEQFKVKGFTGSLAGYRSLGIHYSHMIEMPNHTLSFGINANRHTAFEAGYFTFENSFDITKIPGDSLRGELVNLNFGYTTSNLNDLSTFSLEKNGYGWSVDIGFIYTYNLYEDGDKPYDFKLGFSIKDIGRIRIDKNASAHRLHRVNSAILELNDYKTFSGLGDFPEIVKTLSYQSLQDSFASALPAEFTINLPGSFNLSLDYSIKKNFYLGANLIQKIPNSNPTLPAVNQFLIAPRFEHRRLAASGNVSILNWKRVYLGAYIRLGFLVVGSDNLASLIGNGDYYGTDIYAALKLNPFNINKTHLFGGGKRGRQVRCYTF